MKRGVALAGVLAGWLAFAADPAELGHIKAVYLLPMTHGLDQYLANQLAAQGVFDVVTDPKRADALLADEIGERFEKQFEELYPPPPPPPKEAEKDKDEKDKEKKSDEKAAEGPGIVGNPEPVPMSTFGRGKGNLFLVGRESRRVLWSTYHRPKNTTTKELNLAAEKIAGQLKERLPGR